MSPEPVDAEALAAADDVNAEKEIARNKPLTRPRPGHADLVGMQKYGHEDARPILERASARETAARVALGEVAAAFLEQAYGIRLVSHTVAIGTAAVRPDAALPTPDDVDRLDADPVRAFDAAGIRSHGRRGRRGQEGRRHVGRRRRGGRLRASAGPRARTSTGTASSTRGSPLP